MNIEELQLRKKYVSPPGNTIIEVIDNLGMKQSELAVRMGWKPNKVNRLIKGVDPLTSNTALLLERVLGIKKSFWLNRELLYREEQAKIKEAESLLDYRAFYEQFPYKELQNRGYLDKLKNTINNTPQNIENLLRFFEIGSPELFEDTYLSGEHAFFRISLTKTPNPYAIASWLRVGEIEVEKLELPEYNRSDFLLALENIKNIVFNQPDNFAELLKEECRKCGVAVVYTPCFPNARISGAVRWIKNNPVIQLSDYRKTNDMFWFAFYHEAAHILKHLGKKDIFLDELKDSEIEQDISKESEADEFASEILFPNRAYLELINNELIEDDVLLDYCKKYKTHPAIIVGRLQYDKRLDYYQGNEYKIPIELT
jgi:HTH-type transcriptional regulator / antitoxin HigA